MILMDLPPVLVLLFALGIVLLWVRVLLVRSSTNDDEARRDESD